MIFSYLIKKSSYSMGIVMEKKEGFTLVELLIVIAILSILASIAIPIYLSYRQKAKVTSVALPYAEECTRQIVSYCLELKPSSSTNIDISSLSLTDCQSKYISLYSENLSISGDFTCEPGGYISSGSVNASIGSVTKFVARCSIDSSGIKCGVNSR